MAWKRLWEKMLLKCLWKNSRLVKTLFFFYIFSFLAANRCIFFYIKSQSSLLLPNTQYVWHVIQISQCWHVTKVSERCLARGSFLFIFNSTKENYSLDWNPNFWILQSRFDSYCMCAISIMMKSLQISACHRHLGTCLKEKKSFIILIISYLQR